MNEKQEELLRLVEDVRAWVKDNLEKKNPERAKQIRLNIAYLNRMAHHEPDQVDAALIGAKTIWMMLFEDAWSGFGTRGGRKDKTKITKEKVVQEWNKVHEQDSEIGATSAVLEIVERLNEPDRPCCESTVWK